MKENEGKKDNIAGAIVRSLLIGGPLLWWGLRLLGYDLGWHELLYLLGSIVILLLLVRYLMVIGLGCYLVSIFYLFYDASNWGWLNGIVTGLGILNISIGVFSIVGLKYSKGSKQDKAQQEDESEEEIKDTSNNKVAAVYEQEQYEISKTDIFEDLKESIKEQISEDLKDTLRKQIKSAKEEHTQKSQIFECGGCGNKELSRDGKCEYCD